jgi:hypothetical protein
MCWLTAFTVVVHIKRRLSGRATAHNIREYCGRRGLTVRFPVLSHLLLFAPPLSIGTPTDSNISGTCVQYKAPFGAISGPPNVTPCNVCHVVVGSGISNRAVFCFTLCVCLLTLWPHAHTHSDRNRSNNTHCVCVHVCACS